MLAVCPIIYLETLSFNAAILFLGYAAAAAQNLQNTVAG
jgi:hypothetical protein